MTEAAPDRAVMSPMVIVLPAVSMPGPVFNVADLPDEPLLPDEPVDEALPDPLDPHAAAPRASAPARASVVVNLFFADVMYFLSVVCRCLSGYCLSDPAHETHHASGLDHEEHDEQHAERYVRRVGRGDDALVVAG